MRKLNNWGSSNDGGRPFFKDSNRGPTLFFRSEKWGLGLFLRVKKWGLGLFLRLKRWGQELFWTGEIGGLEVFVREIPQNPAWVPGKFWTVPENHEFWRNYGDFSHQTMILICSLRTMRVLDKTWQFPARHYPTDVYRKEPVD